MRAFNAMNLARLTFCCFSILAFLPSDVFAQRGRNNWYRGGGGGGVNYNYGYSSTAAEGAQRGRAEVIRAGGEANLMNSEALINVEDARSKYIDNKLQWTKTYLERKKLGREYREERYAKERQARERFMANNRAKSHLPRLSPDQHDEASGFINWPEALRADEFKEYRTQIEELSLLRAHASSSGNSTKQMYDLAKAMQGELKKHIKEMNSLDYIAARKFLDGLAFSGYASAR